MTWINPSAFWLFALTVPVGAAFFYRRRATLLRVPSIQFWQRVGRPTSARRFGRYFSNLPALLVCLVILFLLVMGVAGPSWPRVADRELIVIIDAQASMQTIEAGSQSRLAIARDRATQAVTASPDGTVFTLIKAGLHPVVVLARCDDEARTMAAIEGLTADDTDSYLEPAIELANSLSLVGRKTRLLILSDFVGHGVGHGALRVDDLPPNADIRAIGEQKPNVGIASLNRSAGGDRLEVGLYANDLARRNVVVTLRTVGKTDDPERTLATASALIDSPWKIVSLPCSLLPGHAFRVDISPHDALTLDDTAWGVWPRETKSHLRLVTEGNVFLTAALEGAPSVLLETSRPTEWAPDSPVDVTIFDTACPRQHPPSPGAYIFFGCPDPFGWVQADASQKRLNVTPTNWAADHPALKDVELEGWRVAEAAGLMPPPGAVPIAAAENTVLIFEVSQNPVTMDGRRNRDLPSRALYFNFSLGDSDLVLHPTFPVLLWNAIDYLAGRDEAAGSIAIATGAPIVLPGRSESDITVATPGTSRGSMTAQGGRWVWTDTTQQGMYRLESATEDVFVAVNCMSTRLAELPPAIGQASAKSATSAETRGHAWSQLFRGFSQPWQLLVLAVVLVTVVEWVLFQRRVLRM